MNAYSRKFRGGYGGGDIIRRCRGDVDVVEEGWVVGCGCRAVVFIVLLGFR